MLELHVNGVTHSIDTDPATPLLYVLRNALKLKGSKLGCGLEQCGACTVLVDGKPAQSCVSPVEAFVGKHITTVEGLAQTETGARVQAAFVSASAAQCGYCTAGFVVAATGLLTDTPSPSREDIVEALTPNLCRCGSHPRIIDAVQRAADQS